MTQNGKPPKTEIRTITPELARQYLSNQIRNRKWRRDLVDRYKGEMAAGRWHMNGQTIVFDDNGRMVDGQHRMMAVSEFGKPVDMLIVTGVAQGLEATIDMGKARTLGDVFQMKGVRNAKLLSRTSKLLLVWEKNFKDILKKRVFTKEMMNVHPQEIYDFYIANQMEIDRACEEFKKNNPITTNVGGPVLAFAFRVLERIDLERCYVFITSFVSGHVKQDWPYMQKVRDEFLSGVRTSNIRLTERERISILFGVWNVIFHGASAQSVMEETLNIPAELIK